MTRFRAVLVLQVCATFTIWAQDYDRLQIRFDGKATLSVSGETPSCGFAGCPYGSHYCSSFWNLCEGERSRTVVIPGSYLTLGAEFGGMSYSSGATLDAVLNFSFLYNKPTLNIPGYSYTPKQELGFLYFVDNVYAATLALAAAACNGDCCPDPGRGSASASASSAVRTTIVGASSSSSRSASCSECPDSDGGGSMHSDPPYPESYRGKTAHRLSLNSGIPFVYTEKINADITLNGSASGCAAAGSVGYSTASAGIITQVAPHPLGVPAIGENEYVWSDTIPATLSIPAAATGYAWGWEPDLNWIAKQTIFYLENPGTGGIRLPIPWSITRTVARGNMLIAQTWDFSQRAFVDGLIYRSQYLPPTNDRFGEKKVFFAVEGKVDYAEVEVFYPSDGRNHPPGGRGVTGRFLIDLSTGQLQACEASGYVEPPNWFYYYSQACGVQNDRDLWYAEGQITYGLVALTCHGTTSDSRRKSFIYIFPLCSPCSETSPNARDAGLARHLAIPIFRCRGGSIEFTQRFLYVSGIHKFISVVEHEKVHKHMYEGGHLYPDDPSDDADGDGVSDTWETQNGLAPDRSYTVFPFPDAELPAYIISYGKVLGERDKWKKDWADCGLQYGVPQSPFPWVYADLYGHNKSANAPQGAISSLPACQ